MGKDKTYASFPKVQPKGPYLTLEQTSAALHNHQQYLQACVNYVGAQLGWRRYARIAFYTALAAGAFRAEIVGAYLLLRAVAGL